MSIKDQIQKDYIDALKQKKDLELSVLRLLKSAIKNKEIDLKKDLNDDDLIAVLNYEKKKRTESAEIYQQQQRTDLAEKEQNEIKIIEKYLPQQLSEAEIIKIIEQVQQELGDDKNNFGLVMKSVMQKLKGGAQGQIVSKLVQQKLN